MYPHPCFLLFNLCKPSWLAANCGRVRWWLKYRRVDFTKLPHSSLYCTAVLALSVCLRERERGGLETQLLSVHGTSWRVLCGEALLHSDAVFPVSPALFYCNCRSFQGVWRARSLGREQNLTELPGDCAARVHRSEMCWTLGVSRSQISKCTALFDLIQNKAYGAYSRLLCKNVQQMWLA